MTNSDARNRSNEKIRAANRIAHASREHEIKTSTSSEDIERDRLDERLDEALAESFPASDPPAVHSLDAVRSDAWTSFPSIGHKTIGTTIEFEQGALCIDAALVAQDLGITPALVLTRILEGRIASRCERGIGEDAGRWCRGCP